MRESPWFTVEAIEFMENNIKPSDHVFEWGSGSSTRWLSQRVESVVSVEHDKGWYERMSLVLPSNVTLLYVPPDKKFINEYKSRSGGDVKGKSFKRYASSIDKFKPFDWVLVDGRARVQCMRHAVGKFDRFLLLDDSERTEYFKAFSSMSPITSYTFMGDKATGYDGHTHETRIWAL